MISSGFPAFHPHQMQNSNIPISRPDASYYSHPVHSSEGRLNRDNTIHLNDRDQRVGHSRQSSENMQNASWFSNQPNMCPVAGSAAMPQYPDLSYSRAGNTSSSDSSSASSSAASMFPSEMFGTEEHGASSSDPAASIDFLFGAMSVNPAMVHHESRSFDAPLSAMPGLPGVANAKDYNMEKHSGNPDVGHLNYYPPSSIHHQHPMAPPGGMHPPSVSPQARPKGLNPTIYNMYRMNASSNKVSPATQVPIIAPSIHVIEETIYSGSGGNASRKQDRFDKTSLFKTEVCTNWKLHKSCTYGTKCHFAHGVEDLKSRMRTENYKTQPCCDPARCHPAGGNRRCTYGHRCNYCHPGEAIRRPHPTQYYDADYHAALKRDFGDQEYPFGIYV